MVLNSFIRGSEKSSEKGSERVGRMIKLRLHGVKEEISEYLEKIHKDENIKILSESDFYKDRGKSSYSRLYLDIEINNKK